MTRLSLLMLVPLFSILWSVMPAQELNHFYGSGAEAGTGNVWVLTNSAADLDFYYLDSSGNITPVPASSYLGLAGWKTGLLSAPGHTYAGARLGGAEQTVLPIFFADASGTADQSNFIPLEADAQDDHQFDLSNLDILYSKIAFSETKLYYSLKCNTMSYPVSSGLTFYSYMGILTQPNADPGRDPIVFALMNTVSAPGIMNPGLYKITGTGLTDLVQIGNIEIFEDTAAGILTMACSLADLSSDPDFNSWYNPAYPLMSTQAMTSRITLSSGNQVADTTAGISILLKPWEINVTNSHLPLLYSPVFSWSDGLLSLQISYSDADHNFAQDLQVSIDGAPLQALVPENLDGFAGPVIFSANSISCPQNWQNASFTVINGGVTTAYSFPNPNVHLTDDLAAVPRISVFPNPGAELVHIKSAMPHLLQVYNLRGQLLLQAFPTAGAADLDISAWPPGIYYVRQGKAVQKLVKL